MTNFGVVGIFAYNYLALFCLVLLSSVISFRFFLRIKQVGTQISLCSQSYFTFWLRGRIFCSRNVAVAWISREPESKYHTGKRSCFFFGFRSRHMPPPFHSVWKDMGYFLTGFLIVSGLALPIALYSATIVRCVALSLSLNARGIFVLTPKSRFRYQLAQ
jgi:hypothetical protein